MTRDGRPSLISLILVGASAGLLSGLFGIGGGTIIVPALVLWLGFGHRIAAGTSVTAILPMAVVGAASYTAQGNVDWIAAVSLAAGMIAGAQVGSVLLARLPVRALQWVFLGFLAVVIVSLWFVVPQRGDEITITAPIMLLLVLVGFVTGMVSGAVGIGGGVVVVPILMFFFGASDLMAKGTSLLMMIPGSLSATFGNTRRGNLDWRAAVTIGVSGSALAPVGTLLAGWVDPLAGNVMFSVYLVVILVQMFIRLLKKRGSA